MKKETPNGGKRRIEGTPRNRLLLAAGTFILCLLALEICARLLGFPSRWDESRVETNSMGFREKEFTGEPVDVLVVGDSYTFGDLIDEDEKTYPRTLEKRLSKLLGRPARVFNAGLPGRGVEEEFETIKQLTPQLKPRLVVLQFCNNDI